MHPFRPHEFSLFLRDGPLHERLTFDKMLAYSEPKRIARAATVRQPTMQVETHGDGISYFFNCKSYPSTTGNRQKGYIRFFRPKNPSTPLERVECEVDCSCLDYRYRWAWAVKQRGSSRVGPTSVNKAWNKAPRITNPKAIILFAAIFPQFIDPAQPPVPQFALLGPVYLCAEFVASLVYASGGRQLRRVITSQRAVLRLNTATGGVFMGAAGLLLASNR